MRRKKQEISDQDALDDILARGSVCHLGLADGDRPYLVPVSYGYAKEEGCLYFHCAQEGHKIDVLRRNPCVCFEVEVDVEFIRAEQACGWGIKYRSVIGYGSASFVQDPVAKEAALQTIMAHYAGPSQSFTFPERSLQETLVVRIAIESMAGKQSGYGTGSGTS